MDIKSLPWYGQLIVFLVIGIMIFGVYYKMYYSPNVLRIERLEKKRDALEKEVRMLRKSKAEIEQLKKRSVELQKRLEELKKILPNRKEIAEILRKIQERAKSCNLTVLSFVPKGEVKKSITVERKVIDEKTGKPKVVKEVIKDVYAEWPINIKIRGSYNNLGIFFTHITGLTRLFIVPSFKIKALKDQTDLYTIQAEHIAKTFIFLEENLAKKTTGRRGRRRR